MTTDTLKEAWRRFLQPEAENGFNGGRQVGLYALLRKAITVSSTTAIYGPKNPMSLNESLVDAFWEYNRGLNMLMLDLWPQWTGRKAWLARERLARGFAGLFEKNPTHLYKEGKCSELCKARYETATNHGIELLDAAKLEVGIMIAILVNTVPTTFYLLLRILSDSKLLRDVLRELDTQAINKDETTGKDVLNISRVRSHCSLLYSVFQETLRVHSEASTARYVTENTTLGDFLFKKGSVVQIPNSVMHRDSVTWGRDVETFQPRRFLAKDAVNEDQQIEEDASGMQQPKTHIDNGNATKKAKHEGSRQATAASSYRPFGGGSTLCPGRHFAMMEILSITALILWRFDVTPANKSADKNGSWHIPVSKQDSVVEGVAPPGKDVNVYMKEKTKLRGKDWSIVCE